MDEKNVNMVIVSAPSGCGKDTIIEQVCQRLDGIGISISCTTRKARKKKDGTYEQHGVDYFFMEKPEFEVCICENGFLEYADVKGDMYGTPRAYVEKLISDGDDVIILNIENEGAAQVKAANPDAISIFILPPSAQELRRRLVDRKSETPEQIERRMDKSSEQMKTAYGYDYIVLNNDLEAAIQDVVHIICTVRRRTKLHKALIDQINETFVQSRYTELAPRSFTELYYQLRGGTYVTTIMKHKMEQITDSETEKELFIYHSIEDNDEKYEIVDLTGPSSRAT